MDAPHVGGTRLGVVVGTGVSANEIDARAQQIQVTTAFGSIGVLSTDNAVIIARHGIDTFTTAHLLDHRRAIAALCELGCDRVLAIASVGSLRNWPVGTCVSPFDFIAFGATHSFFDDARGHSVPGFDAPWRDAVISAWRQVTRTELMDGGVYAQTTGPRFETAAEIRLLADYADIIGMTVASECVLAKEAGLAYAAICVVDNLANGVGVRELSIDDYHAGVASNRTRLLADIQSLLPRLANTSKPA